MLRRALLALPVFALVSCSGLTTPTPTPAVGPSPSVPVQPSGPNTQVIANNVALIASSLKTSVAILAASNPPLPANVSAGATAGLNLVQAAAAAYTGAKTTADQQTAVAQLQAGITAIEQSFVSGGVAIPPKFEPYLLAAAALLPAIEIAVGLPAAAQPVPPTQARAARAMLRMPAR